MLLASFPSGPWQANCYVVAESERASCVVIDPGMDAAPAVARTLELYGLTVEAVLVTHGHVDHVADAAKVADAHGVPVWVPPADAWMLTDPVGGVGEFSRGVLAQLGMSSLPLPHQVVDLVDGGRVSLAGLEFDFTLAPGHTPGSTLIRLADAERRPIVFCGDVIFAGSIGRMDLPGGSEPAMKRTLRDVILPLADDTLLLPGHGSHTDARAERASNPYLSARYLEARR